MSSSNGWSALLPGKTLFPGEQLVSRSGEFRLVLNGDGNLVAVDGRGSPYWASNTQGHPDMRLVMQEDGNLLLLDSSGIAWWDSYEVAAHNGHPYELPQSGAFLVVQDDGNDVLYGADWQTALWNSRQDTYDHGSDLGKWLAKAEVSAVEAVATLAKITKAALPIIDAALIASGNPEVAADVNNAVNSAIAAGDEIQAVDDSLRSITAMISPDAMPGFNLALGLLNTAEGLSPAALANARAHLDSDAQRAAFDKALSLAPQLTDDPNAIAAATPPKRFTLNPGMTAQILGVLGGPKTTIAIKTPLAPLAGALQPKPKVNVSASSVIAAIANAKVKALAPKAAAPRAAAPHSSSAPSSAGGGGAAAAIVVVLAVLLASRR